MRHEHQDTHRGSGEIHALTTPEDPAAALPRLLLVDDDPDRLQQLGTILQDSGMLLYAMDGATALYQAIEHRIDLVLMHDRMPDMSGFDLSAALKAAPVTADTVVIFLSTERDPTHDARALAVGAADLIEFPFNPPVVKARVHTYLRLKRQSDLLRSMASIDSLTGIASRQALDRALTREWQRAFRTGSSLAALLIGIDHFKSYTEHYGQYSANNCLMAVASALSHSVHRPADLVAHHDHEHFVMLLPETPLDGAFKLAQQVCETIRGLGIPHEHSTVLPVVTVSIGVVAMEPDKLGREEQTALLRAAEQAMQLARLAGHDRALAADSI